MSDSQQKLFPVTNHSRLGEDFENEIQSGADFYRLRGIVDCVKNPSAFDFARGSDWHKAKDKFEKGDPSVAKTGDGRYLMRVYSNVDFTANDNGIIFDTKETTAKVFALSMIKDHQFHRLKQSAKCGNTSGFLIKMKTVGRVFFVSVQKLEKTFEKWEVSRSIGKRAKAGTASLTIDQLAELGVEIPQNKINGQWLWYETLRELKK